MNFEFELKKGFETEAPELPEALKKENVIAMLEKDKATPKKKKKHILLKVVSVAAALVIVIGSVYALPLIMPEKNLVEAQTTTVPETTQVALKPIENGLKATKLMQAESADDLKNHFIKIYRENKVDDFVDSAFNVGFATKGEASADGAILEDYGYYADSEMPEVNQAAQNTAAPAAPVETTAAAVTTQPVANSKDTSAVMPETAPVVDESADDALTGSGKEESYGKTNTQVENVDEADIIKNDGKYLYILSGGVHTVDRRVTIVSASDMKVMSRIELEGEDCYFNIQEMYVNGDRLVLLASEYEMFKDDDEDGVIYDRPYPYSYNSGKIVSVVYDISDRENPEFLRKVSQDGSQYVSSRMIDGVLYTVSSYWVRGNSEEEIKENAIPDVNGEEIKCDCIYVYDYDSEQYIILSAYDTKADDGKVSSLSILGSGDEVYCSQDALYVAGRQYDYEKGDVTEIYSFSLNGTEIAYRASGAVKGTVLNQFSLDEYKENLRIATTYYSYRNDLDVSNVYVLNKDLQLIGKLEDIAYDEQVKSVRFMGDTGYIVTFRNTDPLFTLDLSDPAAPKVVGEVKLPGFSSYLHPVGEGLVVGLGYDGNEENADFNTVKVSLFDVSDLKNPKEVDTFVLKGGYSQALDNPKAFITYPEENLIGFPVEHYDERIVLSYKLLKIENGEISSHLGYVHDTQRYVGDVFRGTYIGQKLYTIDNYNVCEFDIATAEMLRKCEILDIEDDMPDYEEYKYYDYGYEVTTPAVAPGGMVVTTAVPLDDADSLPVQTTVGVTVSSTAAPEETTVPVVYGGAQVPEEDSISTEYKLAARVIEIQDNGGLLVEVTDQGSSGLSVGTQAVIPSGVEAGDGNMTVDLGDTVTVVYDGVVQETYPVQLPNVTDIY